MQQEAHQCPALRRGLHAAVIVLRHVEQRLARHHRPRRRVARLGAAHAALGLVNIVEPRLHALAGAQALVEGHREAGVLQQHALEAAQHQAGGLAVCQPRERGQVVAEQRGIRIFARAEAHQQFVEIERRQQRIASQRRHAANPFGLGQRLDFAAATPRYRHRMEMLQHRAQRRMRALGALGHHRDAAMVAREDVEDQAGLAIRPGVQHKARLVGDARLGAGRHDAHGAVHHGACGRHIANTGHAGQRLAVEQFGRLVHHRIGAAGAGRRHACDVSRLAQWSLAFRSLCAHS
ncbi:hypothetical protein D3C81_1318250 [compost metagenome]